MVVEGLESYYDREQCQYAHFVDAGLTDNLGLRALYEIVSLSGGTLAKYSKKYNRQPPKRVVMISVNAATEPGHHMDSSDSQPSLGKTIGAMSNIQLHRYNTATIELMKKTLVSWAQGLSTEGTHVESYFILLDFNGIHDPERRKALNPIPPSFNLSDNRWTCRSEPEGGLLRTNPEYQRLLTEQREGRVDRVFQQGCGWHVMTRYSRFCGCLRVHSSS